ncbi:MAG: PKD domain-containing protein [Candidatus Thermoplasmatota archaeon]|nr:PKD domain-containing protein [Candidatus Thermoplasmatota archaeon]
MKLFGPLAAAALLVMTTVIIMNTPVAGTDEEARASETWTVLSYMSGDNDLESYLIGDLNEMERIPSSSGINIVVQIDRHVDHDSSNGDWMDTRRYLVQHDETSEIASTRLDDPELGEKNMDDPWTLREFLTWGFMTYPADHYMITFHGHGNGPATGLMNDDSSTIGGSKRMETDEMGWAIRSAIDETIGRPVDIISLDVCWMGMLEAAMEVMDHSKYFIGSFDQIPAAGWPYDICFPLIFDDTIILEERVTAVVNAVMDEYVSRWSFASLSALDQEAVKGLLVPVFSTFAEEMFYSIYSERGLYDSLLEAVDRPSGKDGHVYNDRYIDLYQFSQYLSQDQRTPARVRTAARAILDTEDEVIVHRRGGANHPPASRLLGLYFPVDMDDPDYGKLVVGTTAWDDTTGLYVREIDARPQPLNWTAERPSSIELILRTTTPETITQVTVEILDNGVQQNLTLTGSGGIFMGTYVPVSLVELQFRFRVFSIYGGAVDLPPDGYGYIRFSSETDPPEVWHDPPAVISIGPDSAGLQFYIRDSTGIEITRPDNVPRIEYRELGKSSWYSKPLVQRDGGGFNGWVAFAGTPTGTTPGERIEYRIVVEDVLGNSATYPPTSAWESLTGIGGRFLLDGSNSKTDDHSLLLQEFTEMGMVIDISMEGIGSDQLSGYKGYILMIPDGPIPGTDVDILLEFIEQGGEFLLILDPADPAQVSMASILLEELDVDPISDGFVNGFYPSNSYSELGSGLPLITGTSTGSFRISGDQKAIYYTEPPLTSMYSDWFGMGRVIVSVPDLLNDAVMERESNRLLADRVIGYLYSNMPPVIDIAISPSGVVVPGQAVTFDMSGSYDRDGVLVSYSLSLSDNTYIESTDPVFTHIFETTGSFTALLKAYDQEGEVGSRTVTVKVNKPPTTDIGISSIKVHAGEQVTFTYKGMDPDGDEFIVEWDFGDGFKVSGLLVHHFYNRRGEFTYRVVVRDSNGLESSRTGTITVLNSQPSALIDRQNIFVNGAQANFSGELMVTLYVKEGDTVRIPGDLSYDPDQNDLLNFTWDMGDGERIYEQIAVHKFLVSGLIRVNLTVNDGFGGVDSAELFVSISNRPPFAAFENEGKGRTVRFNASLSIDDPWDMGGLEYRWDFGDGDEKVTMVPLVEHDYTFGGRYRVKLTVVDGDGDMSTFEHEISVSGIGLSTFIIMIILLILLLLVIAFLVWKGLNDRMIREEKGLLELLGLKRWGTTRDDRTGSHGRSARSSPGRADPDRHPPLRDRPRDRREMKALPPVSPGPMTSDRDRGEDD